MVLEGVLAALLTASAFALDSLEELKLDPRDLPGFSCMVKFIEPAGAERGTCSATLISSSRVLTAAHCDINVLYRSGRPGNIYCGKARRKIRQRWMFLLETDYRSRPTSGEEDLMILDLDEPLDIPPAAIPSSDNQARSLLDRGDCAVYGFGLNWNWEDSSLGVHRGVRVTSREFYMYAAPKGVLPATLALYGQRVSFRPGDSGGGLICKDARGAAYRVGSMNENSTPISLLRAAHRAWVDAVSKK